MSTRFADMDTPSRLPAGAPDTERFGGSIEMRPSKLPAWLGSLRALRCAYPHE